MADQESKEKRRRSFLARTKYDRNHLAFEKRDLGEKKKLRPRQKLNPKDIEDYDEYEDY